MTDRKDLVKKLKKLLPKHDWQRDFTELVLRHRGEEYDVMLIPRDNDLPEEYEPDDN
jgi:hypothetical protein